MATGGASVLYLNTNPVQVNMSGNVYQNNKAAVSTQANVPGAGTIRISDVTGTATFTNEYFVVRFLAATGSS